MRPCLLNTALILSVVGCLRASADDVLPLRQARQPDEQFLVLVTGRVVSGQMVPRPDGYDVALAAGRMFVPSQQVRFTASSMDEAYERMRDSVAEWTPDAHLDMARWCLTNRMMAEARSEILDARHLDPYREDARLMLEGLAREQQRQAVTVEDTGTRPDMESLVTASLFPERRSLGGLPPELARTFTQRIQPLMTNKCCQCHHAGDNEFTVVSTRRGSTAHIAEQNLAAVLNQINFEDPLHSPLLAATEGLHGGSRRLLFPGQSGRIPLQTLRQWVFEAARELSPSVAAASPAAAMATAATELATEEAVQTAFVDHSPDGTTRSRTTVSDREFNEAAAEAVRPDDFDPDVFNRQYHGQGDSSQSYRKTEQSFE